MKTLAILLLLLIPHLCLHAQSYTSNRLGQILGPAEFPDNGYILTINDKDRELTLNGKTIWKQYIRNITDTDYVVITEELDTGVTTSKVYSNGRLSSESIQIPAGTTSTNYVYQDGKLIYTTTTDIDGSTTTQFYLRSSNDKIVGISENGSIRLNSNSYVVQDGNVLRGLDLDIVTSGDYQVQEDGNIVIDDGGVTSVYDAQGRIVHVDDGARQSSYYYDDVGLSRVEITDGQNRTIQEYSNAILFKETVYEDQSLVSVTTYSEQGKATTLYKNGRAVAIVYYKSDGRSVERIEYF